MTAYGFCFLLWHRASDQPRNILLFHLFIIKTYQIAKNEETCSVLSTRQGQGISHGDDLECETLYNTKEEVFFFCTGQDLMYTQSIQKTVTLRNKNFLSSKLLWDRKWTLPTILLNTLGTISHTTWHLLSYSTHPVPHNIFNDSVQNVHACYDENEQAKEILNAGNN